MSMQEWPDDHLDELFRKSAEEFEVPVESAHWDDMDNRLKQHDRQAFYDRLRLWGSAGALAGLLLITLWWAWQVTNVATNSANKQIDSQVISLKNAIASPTKPSLPTALKIPIHTPPAGATGITITNRAEKQAGNPSEGNKIENSTTHAGSPDGIPARIAATESRPTPSATERRVVMPDWAVRSRETAGQWRRHMATRPAQESQGEVPAAERKAVGIQANTRTKKGRNQPVYSPTGADSELETTLNQPLTSTETTTPDAHRSTGSPGYTSSTHTPATHSGGLSDQSQAAKSTTNQPGNPAGNAQAQPDEALLVNRLHFLDISTIQSLTAVKAGLTEAMPEPAWESPERPIRQPVRQPSRFSIMAVVSPDLTAIGLRDFTRPGTNFGLMAQYRLSNRLVVQTGAMITTKKYQTTSEYYVWPSNWNGEPWPSNINGTCTMIDMPLNVRYDWLLRPRGDGRLPARWFASTGLTSYFIKREIYTYDYADPSDPRIMYHGWDNQKAGVAGGKFGFSNLNLSIGYERPISRHLSWQIEPFMKIPLKQVGFFKVKLLSTGAFIGLKYSF